MQPKPYCRVSSSVENFKEKILKNWDMKEWNWRDRNVDVFFLGMYHFGDYVRFLWHGGKKYVFWCGSDILNLRWYKRWIFKLRRAEHFCENEKEQDKLRENGIDSRIRPIFMDNPDLFESLFVRNIKSVYMCGHPGREKEYGIDIVILAAPKNRDYEYHIYGIEGKNEENLFYHGNLSNEEYNQSIRQHGIFIRLNKFEGFSEATGKAVLLGQVVSDVNYPNINREWFFKNVNKLPFQV